MFKIPRSPSWPPHIDLSTARQTIAYIHDDMARVDGMEGVAKALEAALNELEAVEAKAKPPIQLTPITAKFMPTRL